MYLFELQVFIEVLRKSPKTKSIIKKYERKVESLDNKDVQDLEFYKEYYSKFPLYPYSVPEVVEVDLILETNENRKILYPYLEKLYPDSVPERVTVFFDWDLLGKLVLGSFSSAFEYRIDKNHTVLDLNISAESGDKFRTRNVKHLRGIQILRLYEIYIIEAMNLQVLKKVDANENIEIERERELRLQQWRRKFINLRDKLGMPEITSLSYELEKYLKS
jgi:hypothetical protein